MGSVQADRVTSNNYQAIVKKAFREWAGVESEEKRVLVRNVLTKSAMTRVSSDDVVRLFIDWINKYSEFHFAVVSTLFNSTGKTRSQIWNDIVRGERVREDSADADLYKLLIDDLTIGRVIRQARETDYQGNFIKQQNAGAKRGSSSNIMKSAFDDEKFYVLTELGKQFVHYAKNEIVPRIEYSFNNTENE